MIASMESAQAAGHGERERATRGTLNEALIGHEASQAVMEGRRALTGSWEGHKPDRAAEMQMQGDDDRWVRGCPQWHCLWLTFLCLCKKGSIFCHLVIGLQSTSMIPIFASLRPDILKGCVLSYLVFVVEFTLLTFTVCSV
eukprot:Gb_19786 [translate_table: standard]